MGPPSGASVQRAAVAAAALALAYYGLSWLGLSFIEPNTDVATIWLASGVALAVFMLTPRAWWPALTIAVFTGNLAAQLQMRDDQLVSVTLAAINAAEPVLAATVLIAVAGRRDALTLRGRSVIGLAAALIGANAITAFAGALTIAHATGAPLSDTFVTWWLADGIGMLAIAPIAMFARDDSPAPGGRIEAAVLLVATTSVALLVFLQGPDAPTLLRYPYILFLMLLLPALRLRSSLIAVNAAIVMIVIAACTAHGRGPFHRVDLSASQEILLAQGFIVVTVLCTLLAASVVRQARAATTKLAAQHEEILASEMRYGGGMAVAGEHAARGRDAVGRARDRREHP